MASSMNDDSRLAGILDFRRNEFLQSLSPTLPETKKEEEWATYLLSLSRSATVSGTSSLGIATASSADGRALPPVKRRRVDVGTPQNNGAAILSRQSSLPSHPSGYQAQTSLSITTGVPSLKRSFDDQYDTNLLKQPQVSSRSLEPLVVPQHHSSAIRKTQPISVRECDPGSFTHAFPMMATNSASGQTSDRSSITLQPSAFMGSSPYSSSSGISYGLSTSPTSLGSTEMTRVNSSSGASFQNGMQMMRIGSAASKAGASQNKFSDTSPTQVQPENGFHLSPKATTEPSDPMYDISQTGAQFTNRRANEPALNMQKQASNSRQLHPKVNLTPPLSRTPSSADGLEVIRVPSLDGSGSYKEAIKISPATSSIKPSSPDKVKCKLKGCGTGFKGVHEMQRHFDRTHKPTRHVFVCAPLADDPDFLFKSDCKRCKSQRRYHEDYNAGEHLRRMHFNPKQPKTRRGQLKPEERRGGKGGGTEPPMSTLRDYMVTFDETMDGVRVTEPRRLNAASNLIMPTIAGGSEEFTDEDETIMDAPSSPLEVGFSFSDVEYEYSATAASSTQPDVKALYTGNDSSALVQAQLALPVNAVDKSQVADVSNNTGDPVVCDQNDAHANDPMLFDSLLSDASAICNDELADFLSKFP